jgi:hypothetical protein
VRDDFPKDVVTAVGRRASYVCSNPDCRAQTLAPADADAKDVLYVGKVAHIRAASPGGPRYNPSMTAEQRKDPANAIFLCSNCAAMIDLNGGADFPPEVLQAWKAQHETWARANLNRRSDSLPSVVAGTHEAHGRGEVTGLDIQGAAIIESGTVVRATGEGKVTGTRIGPPREE